MLQFASLQLDIRRTLANNRIELVQILIQELNIVADKRIIQFPLL